MTKTLAVFGATGQVGRSVVAQAVAAGHRVVALTRDPRRLPAGVARPVRGDVRDPAAVEATVRGVDAVIVALGAPPSDRSGVRADGTRVVVQAMERMGVERLVCLSVLGAHESRPALDWVTRWLVLGVWLRHAVADHEAQEVVVKGSTLDWTLARPPHFTAKGATGRWRAGFDMAQAPPAMSVPVADVAAFLLACALEPRHRGEAVGVVAAA